jgi:hypothetical protein
MRLMLLDPEGSGALLLDSLDDSLATESTRPAELTSSTDLLSHAIIMVRDVQECDQTYILSCFTTAL